MKIPVWLALATQVFAVFPHYHIFKFSNFQISYTFKLITAGFHWKVTFTLMSGCML